MFNSLIPISNPTFTGKPTIILHYITHRMGSLITGLEDRFEVGTVWGQC